MKKILFIMGLIIILAFPVSIVQAYHISPINQDHVNVVYPKIIVIQEGVNCPNTDCPNTDGWTRINMPGGYSSNSYTFTPPAGKLVSDACYKAWNDSHTYQVDPAESPHTFTNTTIWNKFGCPGAHGCHLHKLTHVSYKLVDVEEEEEEKNEIASLTISFQICGTGNDSEPVIVSFTGFKSVTITPPQGGGNPIVQTSGSAATYYNLAVGFHSLSYDLDDGYDSPNNLPDGFSVYACATDEDPKEDPKSDPRPDISAGAQGPSLISTIAPVGACISGLVVGWYLLKKRFVK